MLTGAVNSYGVIEQNHYRRINESPDTGDASFYTKGAGATYPYVNFQGPLYVAVNRELYCNGTSYADVDYTYNNAVIHKQGLGFQGFAQVTAIDKKRNSRTSTQKFDPFNFGVLTEDDNPFSNTVNNYTVNTDQPVRFTKITLDNQTVQDKLKATTVTSSFLYDNYCNPTNITVNCGDGITQTTDQTVTDAGYALNYRNTNRPYAISAVSFNYSVPAYSAIPLRMQEITYTSFERPNTISENAIASFTYNATGGRVKMSVSESNTNVLTRYYLGGQYEIGG
jgi:hypothetical protein